MNGRNWPRVTIGLWLALGLGWVAPAGELYHQVRVSAPTPATLKTMAALGLPLDDAQAAGADLELPLREAELRLLDGAGIAYAIAQRDLETAYAAAGRQRLAQVRALGAGTSARAVLGGTAPTNLTYGSLGGFYNYDEILAALDKMRTLYPHLCAARVSLGKTGEGRDIWMVKITRNPDASEAKPECLVDGTHHAREPGTYTALLYAMWYLLENYGTDAEATYLVDHRTLYFVPVVNVDGFVYNVQQSPTGGGMWRKNRRNNGDGSYGVDVNRNYPYQWGYSAGGSSPTPASDTYRGPSAGSEPEVAAMLNFVTNHPGIHTALSAHTSGGLLLYAYGYADVPPEHADVFAEYARAMTAENGYSCGPVYATLYESNGVTTDWYLHERDILAFSPEMGRAGFWPEAGNIFLEASENLRSQLHLFWCAGGKPAVTACRVQDGSLNAGQTETLTVAVQNQGWGVSEAVTVQVACTDPYVTVSGGTWTVGALERRAPATHGFAVSVAAGCPRGQAVRFTLTVTQGAWVGREERLFRTELPGLCDPDESYPYLALTSRDLRDATTTPSIRDLIAHRQARGMAATIVATEDILSMDCYQGADAAETLRNFIRDAYNNWETDFVLLGGDTAIIPARKLYFRDNWVGTEYVPSDLYYQCLDGNYNDDQNDKWGEPTDGVGGGDVDLLAEVYLGRASVENQTEMSNWVYKTLLYETQSAGEPYLRNHLLAGQYVGETNFGPGIFGYGKSYMTVAGHNFTAAGYTTLSFDSSPLFHETTLYQYDDDQAGRPRWTGADMLARMNSGEISIINHLGHGSFDKALNIYNSDVAKLTNTKPFFVYTEDCSPGTFTVDCLAERLIAENRCGAFAAVMNSGSGWGSYNDSWETFDGPSLRIQRYFWNSYFAKNRVNLGAMLADGHEDSIWMLDRQATRYCIFGTPLFGDPATPLRGRSENAEIAFDSVALDDTAGNADGVLNPGERGKLWVTLVNVGINGTTGVSAAMSCADPYVTVTDGTAAYGEMPGLQVKKVGQDPFELQVAANCPTPHAVALVLTVTDAAARTWSVPFTVTVYTTSQITGVVTRDGAPAAGVTIAFTGPLNGTRVTDSQGRYVIGAVNGTYALVARNADWLESAPVQVTTPPGQSGVDFAFATAKVSGRVTDGVTGTPLAAVTVVYTGALAGSTFSGADGRYEFTRVYGRNTTLTLTASKSGYFDEVRTAAVPPNGVVDLAMGFPDIEVVPASLDVTAALGGVVSRTLTIRNRGVADLPWSLRDQIVTTPGNVILQVTLPPPSSRRGIAFDGQALWVTGKQSYPTQKFLLQKIDPQTGALLRTLELGGITIFRPYGLAWDGTNLWFVNGMEFIALDPASGQTVRRLLPEEGVNPSSVAVGGGYLWTLRNRRDVLKLNPDSGAVVATWPVPDAVTGTLWGLEYNDAAIWVAGDDGKVYKLNAADGGIISFFQGPTNSVMDLAGTATGPLWLLSSETAYLVDVGVMTCAWMGQTPLAGTVGDLGSHEVSVTFDTAAAGLGAHEATINIRSNDLDQPEVVVPVRFTVTPAGSNQPPVIDSAAWADPNPVTLPAGSAVHVVASDPDGDPLTYAWSQQAGPGTATFATPGAADSGVTFHAAGAYTLRVTVSDGRGGSATSDVTVTVKPLPGDLNGDGVVNAIDLQIVIASFGKRTSEPDCDPRADANGDGVVNAVDLQIVIAHFGTSVP